MTKIIAFYTQELANQYTDEDNVIFVQADKITHWNRITDEITAVHLVSGTSITVPYNVWEVTCLIDPPPPRPAMTGSTRRVISGSLTPGQPVTIESVHEFADGTTETHIHETTFMGIEHNDYTGKDSYVCVGGTFDGDPSRGEDARFSFDVDQFTSTTSNT